MSPRELAAAIRKGAKIRPQAHGDMFFAGRSCALGAAYEGATGLTCANSDYHKVTRLFPILGDSDGKLSELGKHIYRMNDHEGLSREQIADWLDSLDSPTSSVYDALIQRLRGEICASSDSKQVTET